MTPLTKPGVEADAEEFLRQQAISHAALVARQDWLLGIVGVLNAHLLLYALFVESNQPLAPMGVKQWSSKLQPEADRASALSTMAAVRRAFRTEGRARAEHVGATWPVDVDDAIAALWSREGLRTDADRPGDC